MGCNSLWSCIIKRSGSLSQSALLFWHLLLVYELIASDKAMNAYMRYINEKADSSFLYDKYTNQSIAAHLMRTFSSPKEPASVEQQKRSAMLSIALTVHMGSISQRIITCHYTVRFRPPQPNVAGNSKTYSCYPLLTGRWTSIACKRLRSGIRNAGV